MGMSVSVLTMQLKMEYTPNLLRIFSSFGLVLMQLLSLAIFDVSSAVH